MEKNKIIIFFIIVILIILLAVIALLYALNYIPHKSYTGKYFNIQTYISNIDKDSDGVDDQTDMLQSAKAYISTKPKYESKYYATGYPNDEYGVCTDVIGFAMLNSGYDLMNLVNEDILANKSEYDITTIDKNIDFRRVQNLEIYFRRTAISLTTDLQKIEEWQAGDIVTFDGHIAIISDKRNKKGIPFIIHNANPFQARYEEDLLEIYEPVGHYRVS